MTKISPTSQMLSARAIATEISAKRLKPIDALQLPQATIESHESRLRIFSSEPSALTPAKGPLSGISVGVKDIFDTNDQPTAYGSKIYTDHHPVADAALVSMLKNAGATIAGKTVTTEFAWFSPGPTRNPHNTAHTPGGSSSGSAAGVAGGFFPAAIGTQTGGSIIRPAAFCGVAGYKPSFRLFPTVGLKQFSWSLDTIGFFAASVADVAFVAAATSGRDIDIGSKRSKPFRIGIYKSSVDDVMEPDMADALKMLTKVAKRNGAAVVNVKGPKSVENARASHAPIQGFEARLSLADEFSRNAKLLSPKLRSYLRDAENIKPEEYDDARRTANRARKASHGLFENCDVLLLPSAPGAAPRTLRSTGNSIFNQLWTLLGLPCVNVPGLFNENGLPLGVQIIAPFGQDKLALQAAHWLETTIANDS